MTGWSEHVGGTGIRHRFMIARLSWHARMIDLCFSENLTDFYDYKSAKEELSYLNIIIKVILRYLCFSSNS